MERTPRQLAEVRMNLAADYAAASEALEHILAIKPATWQQLRETVRSDKAADRLWEATEPGIEEMRLRSKCKRIEKQMSAIKTMIEIYQGEARNNY